MHGITKQYIGRAALVTGAVLLLLCPYQIRAQVHEYGLSLGGYNYTGDLSQRFAFTNYRPGGQLFYRYNVSPAFAFRTGLSFGVIYGKDLKANAFPVTAYRGASFRGNMTEFSVVGEYNFIDYGIEKQVVPYCPYLIGGLAAFFTAPTLNTNTISEAAEKPVFQLSIPFGVGIKYRVGKTLNLGLEFVARKTFTDELDGVNKGLLGLKSTGDTEDRDWYFYTAFSISRTIYGVKCPQQFRQ